MKSFKFVFAILLWVAFASCRMSVSSEGGDEGGEGDEVFLPLNLRAEFFERKIDVSWSEISDAAFYKVIFEKRIEENGFTSFYFIEEKIATATSAEFLLTSGGVYKVSVFAFENAKGDAISTEQKILSVKDFEEDSLQTENPIFPSGESGKIARATIESTVGAKIKIFSDVLRTELVAEIPAYGSAQIFETAGEKTFYYTFFFEVFENIFAPYDDTNCAFTLLFKEEKAARQKITFPENPKFSECYLVVQNESETSAVQLMTGSTAILNTEGATIINPKGSQKCSASYRIKKSAFLNSFAVKEILGSHGFFVKDVTGEFDAGAIYKVQYEDGVLFSQKEKIGFVEYSVRHYFERLFGGYDIETETLYGIEGTLTGAVPFEREGFEVEGEIEQKKLSQGSATNVSVCYKRKKSTLTFYAEGGDFLDCSTQKTASGKFGKKYDVPENPVREHYTFLGWEPNPPKNFPAESQKFFASWSEIPCYIFDACGGIFAEGETQKTFYTDAPALIECETPARTGYDFMGWEQSERIFRAKWRIKNYKITYNLDGGENANENPATYTVESGAINLLPAQKQNHEFAGWFLDAAFSKAVTKIADGSIGNLTLYVKWRAVYEAAISVTLVQSDWGEDVEIKTENVGRYTTFSTSAQFKKIVWYFDEMAIGYSAPSVTLFWDDYKSGLYSLFLIATDDEGNNFSALYEVRIPD